MLIKEKKGHTAQYNLCTTCLGKFWEYSHVNRINNSTVSTPTNQQAKCLKGTTEMAPQGTCCGYNLLLDEDFSNQFDFYFLCSSSR